MTAPGTEGRRAERMSELIRAVLAELLRDMDDRRLTLLVITYVRLTDDLSLADVGVRTLVGSLDQRGQRSLIRALSHAKGRLRHGLAGRVEAKRLPDLRFHYDEGQDNAERVDVLLREIERERK